MKFKTKHTFAESAIWLGVAVLILIYGVVILQQSPHIPLLFSIAVIVLYGVTHKVSWSEIREGIIYNISESIEAILIICLIGVTVGTWMSSHYLLWLSNFFSPVFFNIGCYFMQHYVFMYWLFLDNNRYHRCCLYWNWHRTENPCRTDSRCNYQRCLLRRQTVSC